MKSSVWTGSVMAGSAFAASLCLYCAASAQADTGDEAPTRTPRTSSTSGPSTAPASTADADNDEQDNDSTDDDGTDATAAGDGGDGGGGDGDGEEVGLSDDAVDDILDDDTDADDPVDPAGEESTTDALGADTGDLDDADFLDTSDLDYHFDDDTDTLAAETDTRTSTLAAPDTEPNPTHLALAELADAQSILTAGTWGQGNLFAGIASLTPQLLIGTAQASLHRWDQSIHGALNFYASTEDIPIIRGIAAVNLMATQALPALAQSAMSTAQGLLPLVAHFGADEAVAQAYALVADAQQDGMVYATIPVGTTDTRAIVYISVNGGDRVPVMLDTGSRGLLMNPDYVPRDNLGHPENTADTCAHLSHGRCEANYGTGSGDDKTYFFDVYTTTVDFGNGLVTQPTYVGVATDSSAFDQEYHGILGVGPHSASPLMSSVTSALPGWLSHGMLLDERGGYLTFGPNPLPRRVHRDGSPHVSAEISLNGGPTHKVTATIDSGGGYGAISSTLVPTGGLVPGTVLSVYADDGKTLLYSYTLTEDNIPKESKNSAYFNTGVQAFMSGPIYVDFTKTNEEGEVVGATDFDYSWWGWKAPAIRLPWI